MCYAMRAIATNDRVFLNALSSIIAMKLVIAPTGIPVFGSRIKTCESVCCSVKAKPKALFFS